jgi:hypothetical protein
LGGAEEKPKTAIEVWSGDFIATVYSERLGTATIGCKWEAAEKKDALFTLAVGVNLRDAKIGGWSITSACVVPCQSPPCFSCR